MKPIPISELIEAIEFESMEGVTMIDTQEARLVLVDQSILSAVEEGDEESLRGLPEWQREQADIACAMVEDPARFIDPPDSG